MKAEQELPENKYPYLAVHTLQENLPTVIDILDVVIVSLIKTEDEEFKPYVKFVFDDRISYFTTEEKYYLRLPKGYKITLTQ